jgi:hypothetical protein
MNNENNPTQLELDLENIEHYPVVISHSIQFWPMEYCTVTCNIHSNRVVSVQWNDAIVCYGEPPDIEPVVDFSGDFVRTFAVYESAKILYRWGLKWLELNSGELEPEPVQEAEPMQEAEVQVKVGAEAGRINAKYRTYCEVCGYLVSHKTHCFTRSCPYAQLS